MMPGRTNQEPSGQTPIPRTNPDRTAVMFWAMILIMASIAAVSNLVAQGSFNSSMLVFIAVELSGILWQLSLFVHRISS